MLGWYHISIEPLIETVQVAICLMSVSDDVKIGKMQDGVVYRGISPDILMIDRKGRLQVSAHVVSISQFGLRIIHAVGALIVKFCGSGNVNMSLSVH